MAPAQGSGPGHGIECCQRCPALKEIPGRAGGRSEPHRGQLSPPAPQSGSRFPTPLSPPTETPHYLLLEEKWGCDVRAWALESSGSQLQSRLRPPQLHGPEPGGSLLAASCLVSLTTRAGGPEKHTTPSGLCLPPAGRASGPSRPAQEGSSSGPSTAGRRDEELKLYRSHYFMGKPRPKVGTQSRKFE